MKHRTYLVGINWLKSVFRAFRYSFTRQPNYLWSRGFFKVSDWAGTSNFLYPAYPTRYRVKSLNRLKEKSGIIWLRLGSDPPKPEFDNDAPGDLVLFAHQIIGNLGGKTVLITTDGDRSIPSGLPKGVADKILSDANIVAWYTQNLENPIKHEKIHPVPIGIDFHTRLNGKLISPNKKANILKNAVHNSSNTEQRIFRIWSDVHLEADLGNMLTEFPDEKGKPGGKYFEARNELRSGIESGELSSSVDVPEQRIPIRQLWEIYGRYMFVISLPGHGLDCHRTWEALALGAIVISISTPIDELLKPYRVVLIDRQDADWWKVLSDPNWIRNAFECGSDGRAVDLSWNSWISSIKNDQLL